MSIFNPETLIASFGLIGIGLIVFAESGLLIGFFLPGDTLLLAAGFFAAQNKLWLPSVLIVVVIAAIVGDNVGYTIGRQTGHRIFRKKDGILFRQEYLEKADAFYEKHGGKTVIFARFIPVVRTFAPVVAGAAKMDRRKFITYNIVGAVLWGVGVTLLGYWLGSKIPDIDKYLLPAILIATAFTFSPAIYHIFRDAQNRKNLAKAMRRRWHRFLGWLGIGRSTGKSE